MTLIAILAISLFFTIPFNNKWLYGNILNPNFLITRQIHRLNVEDRKALRYGPSYIIYRDAANEFARLHIKDAVVLLPPKDYFRAEKMDFQPVEPAEFYYFTGYKAVWTNSPGVEQANWVLMVQNHKVMLTKINSKQELNDLLALYKPYIPGL